MKKVLFYFFVLTMSFVLNAQVNPETKRANHWYFGQGASIDWSSGSPVAGTNGQTNTWEGAASISDLNGNLLFYSDGNTIWNKNHVPMQGGYDLLGCDGIPTPINVTQNALIIPHPGNDSLYYLFHLGCLDFQSYTLNYTIVNMKLNAGLGGVISTNNALMITKAQALAACRHADGCSVWIVGIDTNQYYNFFKFDVNGLDINNPVTQFMQLYQPIPIGYTSYISFSNDLTKIANITYTGFTSDTLIICEFDNLNATVSNPIKICTYDQEVYAIRFSPDNSKLYAGGENPSYSRNKLFQFDLTNYNETAVLNSKTVIYDDSILIGQMQIGLDNKIYMARGSYSLVYGNLDSLAVINNPNASGLACNFNFNAVYLNGKQCIGSLPNFDQGYFYPLLNNSCLSNVNEITGLDFKIYPNPATDFITIENTEGFDFDLQILDVNGKIISWNKIYSFESKKINLQQLPKGLYLIQLKNNELLINYKLLKN